MTEKRIRVTGKTLPRIKDTGKKLPRIDPEKVRKALGAEKCSASDLPEHIKQAALSPFLARPRRCQ